MKKYLILSDEEIFVFIKSGDSHAFGVLYERYKRPMIALALKKVEEEEVEDLIHDLFTKLWLNRNIIEINQYFKGYIYRSLRNKILDLIAHKVQERKYLDSLLRIEQQFSLSPDQAIREQQFLAELDSLMHEFNPQDKKILKMRMEGYSNPEIAELLGLSEKTIRNKYSLITKSLGGKLKLLIIYFFLGT